MNTPLNTPQRHGSVPLAHSTPDADQARPGDITHPQLRVLVRAARAFTDKRRIEAGEAPFWQAVHQTVHQPQAPVQNQAKSNPPRVETIEQGIMHADGFLEYTESLAVHCCSQGRGEGKRSRHDLRPCWRSWEGGTRHSRGCRMMSMRSTGWINSNH